MRLAGSLELAYEHVELSCGELNRHLANGLPRTSSRRIPCLCERSSRVSEAGHDGTRGRSATSATGGGAAGANATRHVGTPRHAWGSVACLSRRAAASEADASS